MVQGVVPRAHAVVALRHHVVELGYVAGCPNCSVSLTYHRLDGGGASAKPLLAEGAQPLLDVLDRMGVDFRLNEVRGALEDIRSRGERVVPFCPFVRAYVRRHPEYADLVTVEE